MLIIMHVILYHQCWDVNSVTSYSSLHCNSIQCSRLSYNFHIRAPACNMMLKPSSGVRYADWLNIFTAHNLTLPVIMLFSDYISGFNIQFKLFTALFSVTCKTTCNADLATSQEDNVLACKTIAM